MFFFFKQKTAYDVRISDWSSDVCSSDLMTGRQARLDCTNCLNYGTRIVAGVTPGRGGEEVLGVPVFNTMKAAVAEHPATASVIYVPAPAVTDAVLEALDAGIKEIGRASGRERVCQSV